MTTTVNKITKLNLKERGRSLQKNTKTIKRKSKSPIVKRKSKSPIVKKKSNPESTVSLVKRKSKDNEQETLNTKSILLKGKLETFFSNKKNFDVIYNCITKKTPCSLSSLDWFVTNYSKKNPIYIQVGGKDINIFTSYRDKLLSFHKSLLDPCKRNYKLYINYDDKKLYTSIGQLLFFKWIISLNILDYIKNNINLIKQDMEIKKSIYPKNKKKETNSTTLVDSKTRKKRESLCKSLATKPSIKRTTGISITFN
jgi:hypothetical protein